MWNPYDGIYENIACIMTELRHTIAEGKLRPLSAEVL